MKLNSKSYVALAVLALLALSAAGVPFLPAEAIAPLAMAPMLMGDITLVEIKSLIDKQGEAWEEFKRTNDALMKAKADGKAVGDLESKLAKITETLDKLGESRDAMEQVLAQMQKGLIGGGDSKSKEALQAEVKAFNIALRADSQVKGRNYPGDFTEETYAAYKGAFFKCVRVGEKQLTAEEQKALQAGSDPDGGYLLPASTVGKVVTRMFEQSVMRQIASIEVISSPAIEGVVDNDEADAGWVAELGTRSDTDTPQVAKWRIEAAEMYAMPKVSQTLIDDAAVDVEAWLAKKIADKFGRVEGTAFWQGTGVGQPRGLATYTTAATADASRAWGQFEHVKSGANGAFHTDKFDAIHNLMGTIKDHYLPNAQFCMRRSVRTAARKIKEATTDRYMWEPSLQQGQPERLMGYPVRIDEYMPALATDSLSLAFGDFKAAYQIVDRVGIRTLRDPYTAKPYVVFYSTKRVGGGALDFEAVKFIKFSA